MQISKTFGLVTAAAAAVICAVDAAVPASRGYGDMSTDGPPAPCEYGMQGNPSPSPSPTPKFGEHGPADGKPKYGESGGYGPASREYTENLSGGPPQPRDQGKHVKGDKDGKHGHDVGKPAGAENGHDSGKQKSG
jgi:hypothetical protein